MKFDGAVVNAEGSISNIRNDPDVMILADVENMPLVNLKTYWPPRLLKNARVWIEKNITGGMITDGVINVNIRPEMWALEILPDDSFIFNFNVVEGSSHFLKPMPQLTGLTGKATLRLNHFLLTVESGKVENVDIKNGVLHFNNIAKKGLAIAHFELPISGRVEEILKVIDYKPLGYPSLYGIKQDSILGDAETLLTLDFPLIKELKIKDVSFDVQAEIAQLYIPKLSDSLSLSNGEMSLSVNRDGITSNGKIILNGVGFTAQWQEDFTKTKEYPTTYIIEGDVEGDEWNNLLLPFEPYVSGPAHASLTLYGKGAGLKIGAGRFDLKDSRIEFEPIGWVKEHNDIASADFTLEFEENGIINVNDIVFKSEGLDSEISLVYDGERASRLYVENLKMPDNDFSSLFEWDQENELYQVSIKGEQFNAVPIMDIVLNPTVEGEEADLPDFNLAGSVANVMMYNDVVMQETTVLTGYIANEVIDFGYSGKWDEDRRLSIIIASGEDASAPQRLTLDTNDAGQALRALDFFTSGDQGDLLINADMIRQEKGYAMTGTIKAGDFSVANSKAFSELLKEKEFVKAQEELEKNGLSFSSFEGDFKQYDDIFTIKSGSAKGPTLGVTLDGFVDQKYDEISLDGTIIPAYGLNSFLSNIPILGTIIAGGKGEGVFAATYNMKGTIDDPQVSINPLMALAPGIFRKIFGAIGGGRNKPTAREEAEKTQDEQPGIIPPVE
ncbi:MAG: AsmA-like C-terminal domain-containing protein [Emcibacteraceae bacterium]|nr:AsmA-like C-terminal domain-containing protein [Emcibacteraceae bacterium]